MPVQPKAVVLYARIDSVYYPVACAKDVSINTTSDLLELAPRSSNSWREYEYSRITGTISGTGITTISKAGTYSIFDVIGQQFSQLKFLVKFSVQEASAYKVFECEVLVKELNLAGSAAALSNYSYEFQISGPVTISTTPVDTSNTILEIYEYVASSTVSTVTLPVTDVQVILVYVNGVSKKITSGGYTASEVQWNPSTGVLTFGTALTSGNYVKVVYLI